MAGDQVWYVMTQVTDLDRLLNPVWQSRGGPMMLKYRPISVGGRIVWSVSPDPIAAPIFFPPFVCFVAVLCYEISMKVLGLVASLGIHRLLITLGSWRWIFSCGTSRLAHLVWFTRWFISLSCLVGSSYGLATLGLIAISKSFRWLSAVFLVT